MLVLISVSANHRTASFDLLERLSLSTDDLAGDLVASHAAVSGAVVLATCNRFEAYLELSSDQAEASAAAVDATVRTAAAGAGVDAGTLREQIDVRTGTAVAEHLFAVSAGLDSVVVGEGEIAGQVRRALSSARDRGTTSSELERLFQRASQTSRSIKNKTELGRAGRSLVRLALDLAESRITDWSATGVLLIGTGSYARASLAALRERGALDVAVYSPTGRGRRFASERGLALIETEALIGTIAARQVIITCTNAEQVISATHFRDSNSEHQLVIDLGLPRNVNPDVQNVPGVDLLDLETIRIHAPLEELNAHDDARALVDRATRKFAAVSAEQELTPAIVALRQYMFGLLESEISRARARGDSSEQSEQALRHMVGVLLHTPAVQARSLAGAGEAQRFIDGLDAVFGLAPGSAALDRRRDDIATA